VTSSPLQDADQDRQRLIQPGGAVPGVGRFAEHTELALDSAQPGGDDGATTTEQIEQGNGLRYDYRSPARQWSYRRPQQYDTLTPRRVEDAVYPPGQSIDG
jgi:hypothetical protein